MGCERLGGDCCEHHIPVMFWALERWESPQEMLPCQTSGEKTFRIFSKPLSQTGVNLFSALCLH